MGNTNYDFLQGMARLAKVRENLDPFAMEVFELHTALEIELSIFLREMFPRADKMLVGKGKLGFPEKVSVLNATWRGDAAIIDALTPVLIKFIDLRNNVAHPDKSGIASALQGLRESYKAIDHEAGDDTAIAEIAQGVCAILGDGPTPKDLKRTFDALADLGKGFGKKGVAKPPAKPK